MTGDWLDQGLLGRVRGIVEPWRCHLVGGAVRDHLLGRPARDLDLVTAKSPGAATVLAERLEARLVPIGGDRFAAVRLVGEDFVIDIWDRGEATLDDELARRDLTINSMAVDLADGRWHDPLGGRRDLAARWLRATTTESFRQDPLRVLRLARFAAELPAFSVAPGTLELAAQSVPSLEAVAAERRREELGRTLRAVHPERGVELWSALGFYPEVVGASGSAETTGVLAMALARARFYGSFLGEGASGRLNLFVLHAAVVLAAVEADPQILVDRGYISRREARDIALVLPHRELPAARDGQRWLLHCAAEQWPAALCHAAVWQASGEQAPPPERIGPLVREIAALALGAGKTIFNPEPLLRGDEIRRLLGLESGPEVGVVAKRLRRRQVEGHLTGREEAVDWLLSERR